MWNNTWRTVSAQQLLAAVTLSASAQYSSTRGCLHLKYLKLKKIQSSVPKSCQPYFPVFSSHRWLMAATLDTRGINTSIIRKVLDSADQRADQIYLKLMSKIKSTQRGQGFLGSRWSYPTPLFCGLFCKRDGRHQRERRGLSILWDHMSGTGCSTYPGGFGSSGDERLNVHRCLTWLNLWIFFTVWMEGFICVHGSCNTSYNLRTHPLFLCS